MNELKVFEKEEFGQVRVIEENGEPWFVAVDVCKALEIKNNRDAISRLDEDEKMTVGLTDTHSGQRGGAQSIVIVNEPGLYTLVLGSRKPEAKEFKRWITHEIIPSIRKHGMYATNDLLDNPEFAIEVFTALKEERERAKALTLEVEEKTMALEEAKPKVSYCDFVLQSESLIPISSIAKDYGKSGKWLNEYLHNKKVQYKLGNTWVLYSKFQNCGYTMSKTFAKNTNDHVMTKLNTQWTQKGRMFIYELLKKDNILPVMERENEIENEEW